MTPARALKVMIWTASCLGGLLLGGCMSPDVARLRGYEAYQVGKFDVAKKMFDLCVDEQPSDWKSRYYLGMIALERNDPVDATRELELAYTVRQDRDPELELNIDRRYPGVDRPDRPKWPTLPEIVDGLALAMYRQGIYPQLVTFLREVATTYGTMKDYMRLGYYLRQIGDNDGAVVAYEKAAAMAKNDDPAPHRALADLYESVGAGPKALDQLIRVYSVQPDDKKIADRIRAYGVVPGPSLLTDEQPATAPAPAPESPAK